MSGRTATARREKLSITVERSLIDEVRRRTENVSAFVTYDVEDFRALAAAGTGFDVYGVSELIGVIKGS